MKKLMILGAGIYQVPLIKKAKEMGLWTITASIPGDYPGFKFADEVVYINTTDKDSICKICKEKNIDGIVVSGTDVAVPTQGWCCDELKLKGPSYESAILAQNKYKMKMAFEKFGVRTADVRYVKIDCSYPLEICESIGFPVIFKSIDSSGSRGITKCSSPEEIEYAYNQVKNNTRSDIYIIEKFLDGTEFGAQSFIYDGKVKFFLPHGDYVFHGDTGVPVGHFAPFEIQDSIINDAEQQLTKAISAMKLNNCAINADFILCDNKVYVLEIGARAGATCLAEMVGLFYGFDYYEKIIQAALGIEPDFTPKNEKRQPNAEMLFISEKAGIIKDITNYAIKDERIIDISFDYSIGDKVRAFNKGPDRIGQVIVVGETVEEAKSIIDDILSQNLIKID